MMDAETLFGLGIALIFAGILITLIAVILLFVSSVREKGESQGRRSNNNRAFSNNLRNGQGINQNCFIALNNAYNTPRNSNCDILLSFKIK